MGFNKEYFFKYGVVPAMQTLQDYIGYNMKRKLQLEKHLQNMAETGYQYDRRGQEQMRGFQYDKDLHEMNIDFTKLKDTMQRNRITIQANSDVWEAGQTAGISIQKTQAEQDIRLKAKEKGYDYMVKSLLQLQKKDPAKGDEISVNSYVNSITGLEKLNAMGDMVTTKIGYENDNIAQIKEDRKLSEAEKNRQIKESQKKLNNLQDRSGEISRWREGLKGHVGQFGQMGITAKGVMPQEKQVYILQILADFQRSGLPIHEMSGDDLLNGLNSQLAGIPGMEVTPEDAEFILLNALAMFSGKKGK